MDPLKTGLELIIQTCKKNIESHSDPFITDSVEWIRSWFGIGDYLGLMAKLEEDPESPEVREELQVALVNRSNFKRFLIELRCWIKESKKTKPSFENVIRCYSKKESVKKKELKYGHSEGKGIKKMAASSSGTGIGDFETMENISLGSSGPDSIGGESIQKNKREKDLSKTYTTIDVFFATDRKKTRSNNPNKKYGGKRNNNVTPNHEPVKYGICKVSIPPNHKVGKVEAPKWWKLELSANPKKHFVLQKVVNNSKDTFFVEMNKAIQSGRKDEAFVFVHGYNVTFADAAKRTAQIAFDLDFGGVPIMYSWPSNGATASYTMDEANIQWTKPHIQNFLSDLMQRSKATTIHLIAHSMGNRALTRAFADLSENHKAGVSKKFKKVILTAPDIDADVFKNEIAPVMLKSKSHITMYASSNDLALLASKKVHGYPRAGDSGNNLLVLKGIETIDASEVNTGLLGHSYFAESLDIITDIFQIIHNGVKASKRKDLKVIKNKLGDYWLVPGKK